LDFRREVCGRDNRPLDENIEGSPRSTLNDNDEARALPPMKAAACPHATTVTLPVEPMLSR